MLNWRLLWLIVGLSISPIGLAIERVISLAPSATELVYAAGLGNKIIAASDYSDYPTQALELERVASHNSINIERIIALAPDLIVAWRSNSLNKPLDQLRSLGFNIYYSDATTLLDIAENIEYLSQYADEPQIGIQQAEQLRTRLAELQHTYRDKAPINYFYQLSSKPIYTMAQQSWPSEVFSLCAGTNIFADAPSPYPQIGLEQVIAKAPQIIFTSAHAIQNTDMWQPWYQQIPAVKNHHIWSLNADWLNRPTPRALFAVEQVCQYFEQVRQASKNK